jgi:thiamine biosynthesis lipoprotein ApbE
MNYSKPLAIQRLVSSRWLLVAAAFICLSLISCRRPVSLPSMQVIAGRTMGTTYSIKYFPTATVNDLTQVSRAIEAELEQVNSQMSTYLTTSELSGLSGDHSRFPVRTRSRQYSSGSALINCRYDLSPQL